VWLSCSSSPALAVLSFLFCPSYLFLHKCAGSLILAVLSWPTCPRSPVTVLGCLFLAALSCHGNPV
jgi:hypothetical protein